MLLSDCKKMSQLWITPDEDTGQESELQIVGSYMVIFLKVHSFKTSVASNCLQSAWSYRREVWCNPAGDEICHPGLNSPIVSLHYLHIYYLDYFFSCILIRVRAQFYFVREHYLLI